LQPGYDADMTVSLEPPAVTEGLRLVIDFHSERGREGRGG
jgi:hypothetical protein